MAESGTIIAYLLLIGLALGAGYIWVLPYFPDPVVGSWKNTTEGEYSIYEFSSGGRFLATQTYTPESGDWHSPAPSEGRWENLGDGNYHLTGTFGYNRKLTYLQSRDVLSDNGRLYFRQSSDNPVMPETGKGEY